MAQALIDEKMVLQAEWKKKEAINYEFENCKTDPHPDAAAAYGYLDSDPAAQGDWSRLPGPDDRLLPDSPAAFILSFVRNHPASSRRREEDAAKHGARLFSGGVFCRFTICAFLRRQHDGGLHLSLLYLLGRPDRRRNNARLQGKRSYGGDGWTGRDAQPDKKSLVCPCRHSDAPYRIQLSEASAPYDAGTHPRSTQLRCSSSHFQILDVIVKIRVFAGGVSCRLFIDPKQNKNKKTQW